MKMRYMLVGGVLFPALCGAVMAGPGHVMPAKDIIAVAVSAGGGHLSIKGGKSDSIEISPLEPSGVCEMVPRVSGKKLKLEKRKGKNGAISNCLITVPPQMAVRVEMGGGRLDIEGVSGAVEISKTAGGTYLSDLTGDLKLKMTSGSAEGKISPSKLAISGTCGDVSFDGLLCGAVVNRVCGSLELAWAAAPSSEVSIKSGGGPVKLVFPEDARIKTRLKTRDNGTIRDEFSSAEGTLVSVVMGGGDINVVKAVKKS